MLPSFGTVFGEPIPAYMTLAVVGFVVSTWVGVAWAKRSGLDHQVVVDLGLMAAIAGVLGARLLHVFVDGQLGDYVHLCTAPELVAWPTVSRPVCESRVPGPFFGLVYGEVPYGAWDAAAGVCRPPGRDCLAWAKFWNGGLVWYGGVVGGALGVLWLVRRERFPVLPTLNLFGMVLPLGLFFGRLGCFLGGCCFGVHTEHWSGVAFPPGSPASAQQVRDGLLTSPDLPSLPVYPTQLFEAGGALAIAAFCALWLYPRKRFGGQVLAVSLGLYALLRFFLEMLRADDRGGLLGISTSQWIGLGLVVAMGVLHQRLAAHARRLREAPLEDGGAGAEAV